MDAVQSGSYEELQQLAKLREAEFLQDTENSFHVNVLDIKLFPLAMELFSCFSI